jgi:hypothetical protein
MAVPNTPAAMKKVKTRTHLGISNELAGGVPP